LGANESKEKVMSSGAAEASAFERNLQRETEKKADMWDNIYRISKKR
jgi:hypothetical protein